MNSHICSIYNKFNVELNWDFNVITCTNEKRMRDDVDVAAMIYFQQLMFSFTTWPFKTIYGFSNIPLICSDHTPLLALGSV